MYLEGTACLSSAKFHTKTEVMGKTDMEEIICKVIRAIILIKILKNVHTDKKFTSKYGISP